MRADIKAHSSAAEQRLSKEINTKSHGSANNYIFNAAGPPAVRKTEFFITALFSYLPETTLIRRFFTLAFLYLSVTISPLLLSSTRC